MSCYILRVVINPYLACYHLPMNIEDNLQKAKQLLEACDAIFITAEAGMGVDSGLPDFRGGGVL